MFIATKRQLAPGLGALLSALSVVMSACADTTYVACGGGFCLAGYECRTSSDQVSLCVEPSAERDVRGNGIKERYGGHEEECDDGNVARGDVCDARCRREECGNGVEDVGEECDDGNLTRGIAATRAVVERSAATDASTLARTVTTATSMRSMAAARSAASRAAAMWGDSRRTVLFGAASNGVYRLLRTSFDR